MKYALSYPNKYTATAQQGQRHFTVNISSAEWPHVSPDFMTRTWRSCICWWVTATKYN